ncbi:MAG: MYXO-CTERM sorting domain-containing protein, partial [Kofleriaceae bacterium]
LLDAIPGALKNLITPLINPLIQNFLPDPLGIAGITDVGELIDGISPGTTALLETRAVPGGYVQLNNHGLSLGMIAGINADRDPTTRDPNNPSPINSEPNLCVPALPPPQLGTAPSSLPTQPTRKTFVLAAAPAFDGASDPADVDFAAGISETMLDLAGHHLVTSGAGCLGISTNTIPMLNLSTLGALVPSLAQLGSEEGTDPLLLVIRPQRAVDFTIGDNTMTSPAMNVAVKNIEIDFYAFLYERYVRAFTMELTMDVGLGLEFEQQPGQPVTIKPVLSGISANTVTVKVHNSDFLREDPADLEAVLPTVFNLVIPFAGNIPPIEVPSFAGFSLEDLTLRKVSTTQDDFLAIYAKLGAGDALRVASTQDPLTRAAVNALDRDLTATQASSTGRALLVKVATPPVERVRAALHKAAGGAMPEVTFRVDRFDTAGRELEWSYNLNGGLWRPYVAPTGDQLVVRDPAFAWQGKYEIGLKSRVKGDYRTTSIETRTPVLIDSIGPKVLVAKLAWDDEDDMMRLPLWDVVSEHRVQYAFGVTGSDTPSSEWNTGGIAKLGRDDVDQYLDRNGELLVFAKDEAGNVTIERIAPFHGNASNAGCNCDASGPSPGGVALVLIVGIALLSRRRRGLGLMMRHRAVHTAALWIGASAVLSLQPGCSCGEPTEKACEVAADCGPDFCEEGELPFCVEGTCVCDSDIPAGRVGPYSDVATGADGSIWVSAYAQTHGDLVVAKVDPGRVPDEAWEWVDGVPEGPVIIPDSKIRGGIDAAGADVGMYTSIAVANDGTPMVTYFDRDTGSLKFAAKAGGAWQIHTIEEGTGTIEGAGVVVGMYTSLTLRSDDNRPGVAYLAHVRDGAGARAEVRYAAAQTPQPGSSADWMTWVIDTAPLPAGDPENPPLYPLPEGLGLFIDSARMPSQAPVVVYYDRAAGDLKLAKFNTQAGQFADPVVLDGSGDIDAGWSPSVQVDATGKVHVAYVGATADDLKYITDAENAKTEIVDDGYRIVGVTVDNLPKPEFHLVGDDASLVLVGGMMPMIAYQDATTHELLLANRMTDGTWTHISIAGATDPWPGGYGYFVSDAMRGNEIVMSTWVINQPGGDFKNNNWVEVFTSVALIE